MYDINIGLEVSLLTTQHTYTYYVVRTLGHLTAWFRFCTFVMVMLLSWFATAFVWLEPIVGMQFSETDMQGSAKQTTCRSERHVQVAFHSQRCALRHRKKA